MWDLQLVKDLLLLCLLSGRVAARLWAIHVGVRSVRGDEWAELVQEAVEDTDVR